MTANDVADMFHVLLEGVHTVIPATVLSVKGNRVKVRPTLGIMLENGQKAMIPDLDEVPLLMLGSNDFSIEIELSAGDPLMLMVLEADARKWMAQEWKEPVEAASPARFGLGGCIAIPLCLANGKPKGTIAVAKDGTITLNNSAGSKIVLDKSGAIGVSNSSGNLKGLVDDLWTELNGTVTDVSTWASAQQPPATPCTNAQLIALGTALVPRLVTITAKAEKVSLLLQ